MDENLVTPVEAVPAAPVIASAEVAAAVAQATAAANKAVEQAVPAIVVTPATPAKQSRWKSSILWAAIIAQVIAILQLTGAFKAIGLDEGYVGNVTATVLQLLVIIGIVNNPTDPTAL